VSLADFGPENYRSVMCRMKMIIWLALAVVVPLAATGLSSGAAGKSDNPSPSSTPKSSPAQTEAANSEIEKLWRQKLPGKYVLVGKLPASTATYHGTLSITAEGDQLRIERKIGAITSSGLGKIGFEPEIAVLEIQLEPNRPVGKVGYQLNEVAGHVFLSGYTESPFGGFRPENRGLEFCFPENGAPEPIPSPTATTAGTIVASPTVASPTASPDTGTSNEDELGVLEGVYQVLGYNLQTGLTYSGRAFVRAGKSQLLIVRTSGSYAKRCVGSVSNDSVIRVDFGSIGQFAWAGDADNYARWIGCLYLAPDNLPKGIDASKVSRLLAVETWFSDHAATDKGNQNKE
jgi:hypothetical protein